MIGTTHLLPGMKAIFTVKGRRDLDLMHHVMRGNRRFVLMSEEREMRGFVIEIKRVNPTLVRNEFLVEVESVDRFLADTIYIPEERRGLY
jgi:hypothetical protein